MIVDGCTSMLPPGGRSADFSPQLGWKPDFASGSQGRRAGLFGACCGLKSALRPARFPSGGISKVRPS